MQFYEKVVSFVALFLVSSLAYAQNCPAGIPSAGNPMCIPPDRPDSPYYNGSGAYVNSPPVQPRVIKGYWANRWGAIASDGVAGALGFVIGKKNKGSASADALAACKKEGGLKCKLNFTFFNQCAAFIVGDDGVYSVGDPSLESAKSKGISWCESKTKGCRVYEAGCSMAQVEYPVH